MAGIDNPNELRDFFQGFVDFYKKGLSCLLLCACAHASLVSVQGLFLFLLTIDDGTSTVGFLASLILFCVFAFELGKDLPLLIEFCQSYVFWKRCRDSVIKM